MCLNYSLSVVKDPGRKLKTLKIDEDDLDNKILIVEEEKSCFSSSTLNKVIIKLLKNLFWHVDELVRNNPVGFVW